MPLSRVYREFLRDSCYLLCRSNIPTKHPWLSLNLVDAEPGRRRSPAERPPLTQPCCYLSAPFPYVCPGATFTFWPTPLLCGARALRGRFGAKTTGNPPPERGAVRIRHPRRSGGPCGSGSHRVLLRPGEVQVAVLVERGHANQRAGRLDEVGRLAH